jgi:predicted extracellular nuclease
MHRLTRILCIIVLVAGLLPWRGTMTTPVAAAPQSNDIRISQVYGGGGNTGATYKNDFIELFNAGTTTVDVTGWSVQYASATGTGAWAGLTILSGSIAPGQYYLIKEAQGAGGTVELPTPDITGTLTMGASNGKVALVSDAVLLNGQCPTGLTDLTGYGTANCYEGSGAAPALSNTTAALRDADGCTDTDDNAADFSTGAPTPRNSASPTHSCGMPAAALIVGKTGPAQVLPDAVYTYTLTVENATGGLLTNVVLSDTLPIDVGYASSDPSGTWEPTTHTITWTQATLADATTLTYTVAVTAPTTWGTVSNADYAAWATEWVTPTSGSAVVTVVNDCSSIEKIQMNRDGNGNSLCNGSQATVEGIVYAVYPVGYTIADAAGPWHGLYVYTTSGGSKPAVGDQVRVTGTVNEFSNMTELGGSSFAALSSGNTPYTASVVAVGDIATGAATAESYESVFVEVHDVTVDNANPDDPNNYYEWTVTDGSGSVRVDDLSGYRPAPSVGDFFSVIRGMLNYANSNFKIEPRDAGDVVAGTPTGLLVNKTGPASVQGGDLFSYTLVIENQTAMQLNDLVVSDTLPLDAAFASVVPAGTWDVASHTITWTEASLAHDTVLTYTIFVTAPTESAMLSNSEYVAWASNWLTPETGSAVGTAVLGSGVTPIAVVRAAGDGWVGSIQGKVTVPPGIYRGNAFVIQDNTGGLYIYTGGTTLPAIALGDTVRITGTLDLYSGLLELISITGIANLGGGTPPDPLNLTTGAVAANEGWLVQITGTATWSNTPPVPGASDFTIYANDGSGSVQVFVDKDTAIDLRDYTSGQELTIIGFVGNYNGTKQVMPRYQSDIWDMLPPEVTETYPASDATDVYPYFPLTATFNKALDTTTVTTETFTLENVLGPVEGAVSYNAGTRTATFDPAAALDAQTRYTATLATGIEDSHDIPMATDYVWSFTTGDEDTKDPTITGRAPAPGATEVLLSANVVVTFSEALDPSTLTGNFTLAGPYGAVPAAVDYNPATFVVTLNPSSNLLPTAHYTATVSADVADWAGNPLGTASAWSFETAVESEMSAYHGDIHNHTSISDGSGTPTQALAAGRAAGFDFMAITDHSYSISDADWADTLAAVEAATIDGTFVALRGFEYTQGAEGHTNVYNTPRHAVRTDTTSTCTMCDYTPNLEAGETVEGFYPWLAITGTQALDDAGTLMQFNHPGWINFNDWTFHPEVGDTARLEEVGNGSGTSYAFSEEEYIRSLDYGWKVGATNNADTHSTYWGTNTPHRTGVWMPELTKSALMDALRARRTFATEDTDYELYLKGNGAWMGTEIPNTGEIAFEVYAADPDSEAVGFLELVTNGGLVVTSTTEAKASATWQFLLPITPGVHYYYIRATQPDGDRIVSSPVWTQGTEDIAITDLVVEPSLSTIYNPSLLTARITNRGANTQTVTVTFSVNGTPIGNVPLTVGICTVGPCEDSYANLSWQPTVTGTATVTAQFAPVPGDSPDDNVRSLMLDVTDEKVPLVLIDAGHNNIGTENPRDARHFVDDLTAHGYNVLFNLDEITASDLNTETVKLLIINAYGPSQLTGAEITAIAEYVAAGGSLWLNGMSDYTGKVAWANTVADRQNALVAAIETETGAQIPIRMNDDEVLDGNDNNGYPWGVLWHVYPAAETSGVGLNVEKIQSWSDCSLTDRNKSALTQADLGADGFLMIEGDLDAGTGTYGELNRTTGTDADNQGDAYFYPDTIPLAGAAGYDIPGEAGRLFFYGDSNDPFNIFAYTAGDGKQNELFNLQTVMWLLGEPLQKSTIAEARADAELDNTPDNLDKLVWVEGKITAAYGEFFNVLYVQDETGGITVHAPAGDIYAEDFTRGTTVRVVGTIGAYNGDTEIEFFEAEMVQVLAASTGEVAPKPFTTGAAALEANEGWLTQITGTVTSKVGDEAIFVNDGSGPIRAFLDGYNGDFSDIPAGALVTVKGLISEDGEGRRIRVRAHNDLTRPDDVMLLDEPGTLAITKTVETAGDIYPGDSVTYTIILSHVSGWAVEAMLTDTLPAEMDFGMWVTQSGASQTNDVVTWQGTVAVEAEVRLVFTAVLQKNTATFVIPVVNRVFYTTPYGGGGSDTAVFELYVTKTIFLPLVMRNVP